MAKDAEVDLDVNGALESDIVSGRRGEGADKVGKCCVGVGEDVES